MKRCPQCKLVKPSWKFCNDRYSNNRKNDWCQSCCRAYIHGLNEIQRKGTNPDELKNTLAKLKGTVYVIMDQADTIVDVIQNPKCTEELFNAGYKVREIRKSNLKWLIAYGIYPFERRES